jgi:hypothetical protein
MKNRARVAVAFGTALLALSCLAAAPKKTKAAPKTEKTKQVEYGYPKIPAGKVWISSIPAGAEVHPGSNPEGKLLGRTPLLLDAKDAGKEITITIPAKFWGGKLPDQLDFADFTSKRNHSIVHRDGAVDTDVSRGLTYAVDPNEPAIIALFQPRSASLSEWAKRYPPGSNFSFSEEAARKNFAEKGVPRILVDTGIDLLRRGGKVALPNGVRWVVAQVEPSGEVSVVAPPSVVAPAR